MDLFSAFKNYIVKEDLFSSGEPLLLAVSGGLDSVVLCALCQEAGYDFVIAHANFQLRGEESERDEQFVRQLGTRYGKEVLVRRFDTVSYIHEFKCSIQVAARALRYEWFKSIITANPAMTRVVTAHHQDDNIETLLMNFFKGTGISGLRAMLPLQGIIARPLLFAPRALLHEFALNRDLSWVEDSSNTSDKYTRNYFRHQLIPLVQEVYPAALQNLADNIGRFREIEQVYRQSIEQQKKKLLEYAGNEVFIPVLKLKKATPLLTLVYEIIHPYGFSPAQAEAVISLLDSDPGKYVSSATYRILKDRNWLIISPLQTMLAENILIETPHEKLVYEQGFLTLKIQPADTDPAYLKGLPDSTACLDAAAIQFPLLLRKWQPGDYFYPLGMRKKKKLARFFIDNKLSLAEKEKTWVIEMNKKIIWIVGRRIDDRFRVTTGTRQVLTIESGMA